MDRRNIKYTLEEAKRKFEHEYVEILEYTDAKHITCKCKICGDIYNSGTRNLVRKQIHRKHTKEIYGKKSDKYTLKEVQEKYTDKYKNIIEYKNAKNVRCQCLICGEEYITSIDSLKHGAVHRKCYTVLKDGRCTEDKLKAKLNKLKELKRPHVEVLDYFAYNDVLVKCVYCENIIHVTSRSIRNFQVHKDCKNFNISKGERYIANILKEMNIFYITEYSFNDCKNILPLRFDFYIPSSNICIEYQGEQHYYPVKFPNTTENEAIDNFIIQQTNDNIKRKYCKNKNIKLIEISYWEYNNIDTILKEELQQNNINA